MAYLEFISDKHLFKCIDKLAETYRECQQEVSLKKFYKNKVDPIKFYFDTKFNAIDLKDYINQEVVRQHDKTINNAIGKFHENLLCGIPGFEKLPHGVDIRKQDNTIFAELKNKHNTIKGEDYKSVHQKLAGVAEANPKARVYLVEIIAKKSHDSVWEFESKGKNYRHPRVRKCSGDKFYEIATGDPDAFFKLCVMLPRATQDYLQQQAGNATQGVNNAGVYTEISLRAKRNKVDVLTQIIFDTFDTYNGF